MPLIRVSVLVPAISFSETLATRFLSPGKRKSLLEASAQSFLDLEDPLGCELLFIAGSLEGNSVPLSLELASQQILESDRLAVEHLETVFSDAILQGKLRTTTRPYLSPKVRNPYADYITYGLEKAQGAWIGFVDPRVRWNPKALINLYQEMKRGTQALLFVNSGVPHHEATHSRLLQEDLISPEVFFCQRSLLEELSFEFKLPFFTSPSLWWRQILHSVMKRKQTQTLTLLKDDAYYSLVPQNGPELQLFEKSRALTNRARFTTEMIRSLKSAPLKEIPTLLRPLSLKAKAWLKNSIERKWKSK